MALVVRGTEFLDIHPDVEVLHGHPAASQVELGLCQGHVVGQFELCLVDLRRLTDLLIVLFAHEGSLSDGSAPAPGSVIVVVHAPPVLRKWSELNKAHPALVNHGLGL